MIVGSVVAVFLVTILLYDAYRDRTKDSDGDGLTDYDEVNTYNTVEWSNDTDCDSLDDYDEVIVYHTDPHNIDTDGDYVRDNLEVKRGSDPLKIDSDGGGIDDFNESYTYETNPNDASDDKAIIAKIPNVKARHWDPSDGEINKSSKDYAEISMRDPLVQWYAKRSEIKLQTGPNGEKAGRFYINGENAWNGEFPPSEELRALDQPSYFLTHGRRGPCFDSAVTNTVILKLMGHDAKLLTNDVHAWAEAPINGDPFVINFNDVAQKSSPAVSSNCKNGNVEW